MKQEAQHTWPGCEIEGDTSTKRLVCIMQTDNLNISRGY